MVRIIDGRVATEHLVDYIQSDELVSIDSVAAYVSFGTAYSDTPVVTTSPGPGVTLARVGTITPGSFSWIGDAAGSASWMAWGPR